MKFGKTLALAFVALSSLVLGGCSSAEGVYTIDKAEMKKAAEASLAEMPQGQQDFARPMLLGMIDAMEVSLELRSGGKMTIKASLSGEEGEAKSGDGTWKTEGNSIVFEVEGAVTKCAKSGSKKLTCENENSEGGPPTVFVKP